MDKKELYITAKNIIKNNEYNSNNDRKLFLQLFEAMEAIIFKPESRKGKFDLLRWLSSAAATPKNDSRRALCNINVSENETAATNGKILHVYAGGRLNDLQPGQYQIPTLEPADNWDKNRKYRQVIPATYHDTCEFQINNFSCRKSTLVIFEDNGDIVNQDTKAVIGTHTMRKTENKLMFNLGYLAASTDKQSSTFKMSVMDNMDNATKAVCHIDVNADCFAIIMSYGK